MHVTIQPAQPLRGTLVVPPDKAICHRAVFAASLAQGTTHIRPWPSADDCQRTLQLVQQLGVPVTRSSQGASIEGRGVEGLRVSSGDLDCGESGTTFRLAAGVLAGQPFTARLSAGPSLSRRPMRRIVEPLSQMGARLEGSGGLAASGAQEVYPPLAIQGRRPLAGIRYEMPVASAQVKSAILFAALFADRPTTITERSPTRDHTERMLRAFGATLHSDGQHLSIQPGGLMSPGEIVLPGDVSSAAFFIIAALCVPGSTVTLEEVGLNPSRLTFLDVLARMGGRVTTTSRRLQGPGGGGGGEPRGTIVVESRPLRATTVESREVPGVIDELPILMVAAACAQGVTRFHGIGELRVKETDRIQSMVIGLRRLGARVTMPATDRVEIEGGPLRGNVVESAGDHRTAMSLAVAGLVAAGSTTVQGVACVAKSFPEFFEYLRRVAGPTTVKTVDTVGGVG